MSLYTLSPVPRFGIVTGSGYKLYTYTAGTLDAALTYSDDAGTENANPVVANGAGLFPAIYLSTGSSYKFILKTAADATVWTQDGITAIPSPEDSGEVTGVAGEDLQPNFAAYLSDGAGGLNAGQWYLTHADAAYASTLPIVGYPTATILAGNSGAFRLTGRVSGTAGLTAGQVGYLSTVPGLLTSTPPANARFMGVADSVTDFVLFPGPQDAALSPKTGVWTPVLGGTGGTSGQTYTTQVGRYAKTGRVVQASGVVLLSAKGTITGPVAIIGLPYIAETVAGLSFSASVGFFSNLATNWASLSGFLNQAETGVRLFGVQAAGSTSVGLTTADIGNTTAIYVSVMYLTE